jgi:hypothetical protein
LRCSLTISRNRRRIRLRTTAPPIAFLMLHPNRLRSRPLDRRKTVNSLLERRLPSRYTASYSARRSSRSPFGKPPALDARECVASLLAASCKNFPSTLRLHASAKTVLLMAAALMWLIRSLRQRSFSSSNTNWGWVHIAPRKTARSAPPNETVSVCDQRGRVKKPSRAGQTADLLWLSLESRRIPLDRDQPTRVRPRCARTC